jgi:serine phosphatase RsbU (regulator of sigma subunit)
LADGDIIIACTDGIIEAENHNGEHWGQHRLEGPFSSPGRQTPNQVLGRIVSEVSGFANGAPKGTT